MRETAVYEGVTPVHPQRGNGVLEPPPLTLRGQDDRCEHSFRALTSEHLWVKLGQRADHFIWRSRREVALDSSPESVRYFSHRLMIA